eukprot:TRINITY_DN76156_c0_g1_i1.p1 TRINITY_DN76156_c0_g1~~TRINITY_DN76156_c0_g1_i1.p1  ORF type:complete len:409 (+),score=39.49 TRINITY_DN76156_c0_g1_i1:35-1228(+)
MFQGHVCKLRWPAFGRSVRMLATQISGASRQVAVTAIPISGSIIATLMAFSTNKSFAYCDARHSFKVGTSGARLRTTHNDLDVDAQQTSQLTELRGSPHDAQRSDVVQKIKVGAAQFQPKVLQDNVSQIIRFIKEAAAQGIEVLLLPEAAIPGYDEDAILEATPQQLTEAEQMIRDACAEHHVAAIVGTAYHDAAGRCYNSATVIGPTGEVVGRQHKLQLVPPDESWSRPGEAVHVFHLCGVPIAIIICHDKRYPELVRLPVLAGARLIFYMACESWHDDLPLPCPREPAWSPERLGLELAVYRAQVQARAVENRVWVVKSNSAGCISEPTRGSHGMSSIIDPTGMIRAEAGVFTEEMVACHIDLSEATAAYAEKSLSSRYALAEFWRTGLKHVVVH